jgi:hypothetical protein
VAVVVVRVGGEDGGSGGRLAGRVERTVAMAGREETTVMSLDNPPAFFPTLGGMLLPPLLFFPFSSSFYFLNKNSSSFYIVKKCTIPTKYFHTLKYARN